MFKLSTLLLWSVCLLQSGSWVYLAPPGHPMRKPDESPVAQHRSNFMSRRLPMKSLPVRGLFESVYNSDSREDSEEAEAAGVHPRLVFSASAVRNGMTVPSPDHGSHDRPQQRTPLLRC